MFKAITNIGKQFSEECLKLNSYFVNSSKRRISSSIDLELSNSVETFFSSINSFPSLVSQSEYSLTELFEIDQAIMGTYGSKLFVEEQDLPIKALLRDIIAMWFRYELLGFLERKDSTFFDISGVRSFYDSWLLKERVGVDVTEYERIITNVSLLLENNENLENSARLLLFNVLGKILVTLGVNDDDADKSLQKYIYDINDRQNPSLIAYAEILLNLYVLNQLQVDLKKLRYVNYNELIKAIRFWSSRDEFSEKLFKSWGIYWENDYYSEITNDEINNLSSNKNTLYNYLEKSNLKIGHSFIEYSEHKSKHSGLMSIYKPAPIFIFGGAGVGKSSFLTAFCYDAQMHISKNNDYNNSITLGKDLQAFYQENTDNWHNNSLKPTSTSKEFTFWEDLNLLGYTISDYAGKDVRPDQWDNNLQLLFQKSRALVFFIDEKDYLDVGNLRRKSALFNLFLEYWMASNPGVRHIPIALVLSKFDLLIPDLPTNLQRSTLIPHNCNPVFVEEFFDKRFESNSKDLKNNPYERFCDLILNDKANNSSPALQDVIANLLENFAPFFQRILDLTYNYQIFITSSLPPEFNGDTKYPYGVKAPLSWISSSLEKIYIKETLSIYESEEDSIRNSIVEMTDEVTKMYKINTTYEQTESEFNELASTRNPMKLLLFAAKKDDMNKQMKAFEEQLKKTCQKYGFELDTHNRKQTIQKIEALIKDKESTIVALEDKKRQLLNKKKYNQ